VAIEKDSVFIMMKIAMDNWIVLTGPTSPTALSLKRRIKMKLLLFLNLIVANQWYISMNERSFL